MTTLLQAPAILPRICEAAGWTQHEFLQAYEYNRRCHGSFNSMSAQLPHGVKALPTDLPVIDVRSTSSKFVVDLLIENERITCGGRGTGRVVSKSLWPISWMDSLIGCPITKYVGHKLLDCSDFVIEDVRQPPWGGETIVIFTMPNCTFPA